MQVSTSSKRTSTSVAVDPFAPTFSASSTRSNGGENGLLEKVWYRPQRNLQQLIHRYARWFDASYIVDWITCAIIGFITEAVPRLFFEPWMGRYFTPGDPSISYPLGSNTIPSWSLPFFVGVLPLAAVLLYHLIRFRSLKPKRWHDLHHFALSLVIAIVLTSTWTTPPKYFAGRLRPDFLDRLATGDAGKIEDGHQSFPSGHTSHTFTAMTVLALYFVGKFKILAKNGGGTMLHLIFSVTPLMLSTYIGITRTRDYRHNFSDVLAGVIIGTSFGIVGYLMNFRSPLSKFSGEPKTRGPVPTAEEVANNTDDNSASSPQYTENNGVSSFDMEVV